MKVFTLGLLASMGMVGVGGAVYAVTPAGGFGSAQASSDRPNATESANTESGPTKRPSSTLGSSGRQSSGASSTFTTGSTLRLEGRTGHQAMLGTSSNETFVMLELTGDDHATGDAPTVALSLVIDKSGSMRGTRLANALSAAERAVNQLREGDSVNVVAFDTRADVVVPTTTVTAGTRQSILQSIRGIALGGDTCISCGLESGLSELARLGSTSQSDAVKRVLLLSDGEATAGVRDLPGFNSIAERARQSNVTITTIGVDVSYNEKIMSTIALGANGRHYFVQNDSDLTRVFETEAATLTASVAADAAAELELAPGVELVQVFDRAFDRSGSRVRVSLGSFAKGERKTVLVKVRLPKSADSSLKIADVRVGFRDLVDHQDHTDRGELSVELVDDPAKVSDIDAVVLDRLQRSQTASALREANELFSNGKSTEAQAVLDKAKGDLAANRTKAAAAAPSARAGQIDDSFQAQEKDLDHAKTGFATPPAGAAPSPTAAPATQRQNASRAIDLAF
ncbi:MAG: VWA domain-containing protein [Polyangiaceae bacterium]